MLFSSQPMTQIHRAGMALCSTQRAQIELLLCYKTQCQTILLHTSFKLRFNGHIITFPPMKFKQFQPKSICSFYLLALWYSFMRLWVTFFTQSRRTWYAAVILLRWQKKQNKISSIFWRDISKRQKRFFISGSGTAAVSLSWYTVVSQVMYRSRGFVAARLRAVTCSRSLSSPMTAAVFQSMISEKGSSQPLLSITGTHAA